MSGPGEEEVFAGRTLIVSCRQLRLHNNSAGSVANQPRRNIFKRLNIHELRPEHFLLYRLPPTSRTFKPS